MAKIPLSLSAEGIFFFFFSELQQGEEHCKKDKSLVFHEPAQGDWTAGILLVSWGHLSRQNLCFVAWLC